MVDLSSWLARAAAVSAAAALSSLQGVSCKGSGSSAPASPPPSASTPPAADAGAPPGDASAPPLPDAGADAGPSVLQHHNHASRDGLYLDPAMTRAAARTVHMDTSFGADVPGPTYAQPLYVEGVGGGDVVLVATEQNVVLALDASNGHVVWKAGPLGPAVPLSALKNDPGCGDIDPLGITGTPYVDLGSRTIYLDAMQTPDGGATKKHMVYALSLDDGSVKPGWPVDVEARLASAPIPFVAKTQNQRGALLVLGGTLYVPYGGHAGDCGDYHGWVVGVDVANPSHVEGWATPAKRGGIWAPSGVSSDGASVYAVTGNTEGANGWQGGNAVIRFAPGPVFSGAPRDYFAPSNWKALDAADLDLGGAGALLVDVAGATPSSLVVALGKDQKAYVIDRGTLGGVGAALASKQVATGAIIAAGSTFTTSKGSFVAFRVSGGQGASCPDGGTGNVVGLRITPASPPGIETAWCGSESKLGPPITSEASPGREPVVWATSANRLYAFDGETGEELFAGGGGGDAMSEIHYFMSPIVAKGRVFVAAKGHVYAFRP